MRPHREPIAVRIERKRKGMLDRAGERRPFLLPDDVPDSDDEVFTYGCEPSPVQRIGEAKSSLKRARQPKQFRSRRREVLPVLRASR